MTTSDHPMTTTDHPVSTPAISDSVLESVALVAAPGHADALIEVVTQAAPLFQRSAGCRSMVLRRQVEDADHFRLDVVWDHLDDHLVGFRESEAFPQWRAMVGPHLAEPSVATHTRVATELF